MHLGLPSYRLQGGKKEKVLTVKVRNRGNAGSVNAKVGTA